MSSIVIGVFGAAAGVGVCLILAGLTGRQVLPRPAPEAVRLRIARFSVRGVWAVGAALVTLVLTGWPVGAVLAGGAAVAAPWLIGGKADRRAAIGRTEAIATWTEMVRDSISAASGLEEAIVSTGPIAPVAIRPEVRRLVTRLEHQPLTAALAGFGTDLAHPSGDLVVAALTIAARTEASDLSSLLSRLAEATRGEARMRERIDVGRAETRTATKIIFGAGVTIFAVLAIGGGSYLEPYSTASGQLVLLAIGGIFAFGGWLLVRMAEFDMPERFTARTTEETAR